MDEPVIDNLDGWVINDVTVHWAAGTVTITLVSAARARRDLVLSISACNDLARHFALDGIPAK